MRKLVEFFRLLIGVASLISVPLMVVTKDDDSFIIWVYIYGISTAVQAVRLDTLRDDFDSWMK